ncbi:MAG TPA: ABC transporter substrate-binding protein [Alteraurantiacibacter sp.]
MPLLLAVSGCSGGSEGPVEVAIIGDGESLFAEGIRLSSAAQHLRAATAEGLVALEAEGQVVPALADRWIVTDDGRSYIFRLRDGTWPDGSEITSQNVRTQLRRLLRSLSGTSLGADLAPVSEVRAMAGRVVEIRLDSPTPDFLQILAQPELGLTRNGLGTGPMAAEEGDGGAVLRFVPPAERGLPQAEDWDRWVRPLHLSVLPVGAAVRQFYDGEIDIVLNGKIDAYPLLNTGPLSRGTIRLEPALGLFGLEVARPRAFLAEHANRAALSMAIDRAELLSDFSLSGWIPTTRIVARGLDGDLGTIGERWQALTLEERRNVASGRVAAWRSDNGGEAARISIYLPQGPGSDLLYRRLAADFAAIGLAPSRAEAAQDADLLLVDRTARYAAARWFLNQFNCSLRRGVCSEAADERLAEAMREADPAARAALFAEAEAELVAAEAFIPFGPPVRWSLVRGQVSGFAVNRWAFHPLPALATIPR